MKSLEGDSAPPKVSEEGQTKILLVGVFPPPVHGAALVNSAMREVLCRRRFVQVSTFNLAAKPSDRPILSKFNRVGIVLRAFVEFLSLCIKDKPNSLYLGASGGLGQLYDAAFAIAARLFGLSIVVHHHSFRYASAVKLEFRILTWLAGPSAMHVALCDRMSEELRRKYRGVAITATVSNAAWVPVASEVLARPRLDTIGYFGTISMEKGIAEFLDIAGRLSASGLKFIVGGEFQNKECEQYFKSRSRKCANLVYVGPQYGEQKETFFRGIDLLVFPSKYAHEAEPLTVLEALSFGVPVIASRRGCMSSLVPETVGRVLDIDQAFVADVCRQIEEWQVKPDAFESMSREAKEYFRRIRKKSEGEAERLLSYLCAPA